MQEKSLLTFSNNLKKSVGVLEFLQSGRLSLTKGKFYSSNVWIVWWNSTMYWICKKIIMYLVYYQICWHFGETWLNHFHINEIWVRLQTLWMFCFLICIKFDRMLVNFCQLWIKFVIFLGKGSYYNYVSMFLTIFDQLSNLVTVFTK